MSSLDDKLKQFAVDLYKINAIKFGHFQTKIGVMTPVYCDLRVIVSHPQLLETLSEIIVEYINQQLNKFEIVCGVPYTALPIATVVSLKTRLPMVMRRKEAKNYGTKQLIEGQFKQGDNCLIVEDVVTTGSSILETVKDLTDSGIVCKEAIALLNREQGGENLLSKNGIKMHALLNLTQLMQYLKEANCVNDSLVEKVRIYLTQTQMDPEIFTQNYNNRLKLSFESRIDLAKNQVGQQLFQIMASKKTSLCVAADLIIATDLLNLAESIGPHICLLKTHIDIMEDFNPNFLKHLEDIAKRHNFVLFEDRKFSDIGKTVQLQYTKSIYEISSWANVVTAHSLMGQGVLEGLRQSERVKNRGVFLLVEASSAGNVINASYTDATIKMAKNNDDLVVGVVCQNPLFMDEPGLIQLTPGCHLESVGDTLAQKYSTPEKVVLEKGADIIVIGRGITNAKDPAAEAAKYKDLLWKYYEQRIN